MVPSSKGRDCHAGAGHFENNNRVERHFASHRIECGSYLTMLIMAQTRIVVTAITEKLQRLSAHVNPTLGCDAQKDRPLLVRISVKKPRAYESSTCSR